GRTVTAARARRRATRRPKGSDWRRLAAPGLAALALIAGGAYAVPATRAAIDDVVGTFAGYVAGDDADAPGRPLAPDESPASSFGPGSQPRVIAEADGYKLEFLRVGDGEIDFDLGETGVGLGYSLDDLAGHAVYVLGPGAMQNADEHGHVPLFGVTAPQVRSVEVTYAAGPPLRL